ncbi:MAG: undecaprenyl-diphosphate phosphatase [Rhodothermales bacterium]|nr:undecaprenyl-diphosphate phosphatase [Rhodothermales bacterium]
MTWWEAVVLGLIQGLAEFLPISSSGHLVLGQYLLGFDAAQADDITFEVFVHFGTVLSIVTVYRHRIGQVLAGAFGALRRPAAVGEAVQAGSIEEERAGPVGSLRLAVFILLSMIPTGLVYVFFGDRLEALFAYPRFVCGMLLVTGGLLLLARLRLHPDGVFSWAKVLLVGLAQGAAMIPGISRSGATICTAIYQNVDRKEAADFSFLMSLPVIVGATLLKTVELFEVGAAIDWVPILLGTLVAYASGIWAIKVVLAFVQRGDLVYFAIYCFVIGTLGLVFI